MAPEKLTLFNIKEPHIPPSVQFSSVTQLCPTVCDSLGCSMPDFPVHHQLPELTQIHDKVQVQVSSVMQSCLTLCDPMDCSMPDFPVHHQLPELTQTHVHWVGDATISSFVISLSSHLQSFPASGSFQMSQVFTSGGHSIRVSASTSVLPMNIQDWFPLGWTGWTSFQSKGLSRVFSNTTVQKHQFFSTQLSLHSNSHIRTWLLEKT